MTAFGPQLIGTTEKTLNALLHHVLAESALSEPEWVTLRLASQNTAETPLAELVGDRAHFSEAEDIVAGLTDRGLIADDTLTPDGRALLTDLQSRVATLTAPIWADLDPDEVAATERVLTLVTGRAREVLASSSAGSR